METNDSNNSNKPINDDAKFENSDVDPGFLGHQEEEGGLKGREDKREHNIDANLSIKEMREGKKDGDKEETADALNYKSDRENGSFNPKNI
ncbi:MAG: hypothetical protein EOO92_02845 [Pedobacter sp.]|nr:MAG: hypothetical protein EOO92_02845 [Pedobacter sp.]